ncbi:MAG: hypothetical protein HY046_12420 [Acidobacteria bacterium]|nr:hypothetical protein [Acidobacteriota bacterium]
MRLAKDASSVRALSKTIAGLRAYIDLFKLLRIEDVDLNSQIKIGTESVTVTTAVVMMFETFLLTGHKIADVAATKCLHLLSPSFFVIWDNSTRDELTPRSRSYSLRYAAQFLPLVQGHIAELIQDTGEALNLSRPKAIETIERAGPAQRTLAKRIDEYFYTRFTKGFIPKPKSCGACG